MSSKQFNYESEYKSLKAQYDALLDKNQNDLIKIKQREKQLTVSPPPPRTNSIAPTATTKTPNANTTNRYTSCNRNLRPTRKIIRRDSWSSAWRPRNENEWNSWK
jgi:hypothetical protein